MNTKIRLHFGQRLKELRDEKGLTQEDLAEIVGVHQTYIGKIETGKANVSLLLMYKLTRALNITLYEFFVFTKNN